MPSRSLLDQQRPDDPRPVKRRKLEMPDGFITHAAPKPPHRNTTPRFTNAFIMDEAAVPDSKLKGKGRATDFRVWPKPAVSPSELRPTSREQNVAKPRSSTDRDRQLVSADNLRKSIVLESPNVAAQIRSAPAPPRPLSVLASSSSSSSAALKQLVPPTLPTTSKGPLKALKPLQPPTIATTPRKVSNGKGKDMRTISTTMLGRLNDLSSENGAEELASILLRDQHPEIATTESFQDLQAKRGLELSPEKKGKGNNGKFIRGGLASLASTHFENEHTGLILWQKALQHQSKTPPDLSATIIKVLHMPLPSRSVSKSTLASPGIALCRLRQQNGTPPNSTTSYAPNQLYRVVFSFSRTNSPDRFRAGQTVRIYRPWHEIPSESDQAKGSDPLPRLPASLPLPPSSSEPSSTPDYLVAPINDTALVCTRFII